MPPIILHSRWQSFFPRFYQHPSDATFFTFFSDELTSRHERKTPWKLRENCRLFDFFSSHVLKGSANDESAPSPFSLKISSGLNEFTLIGNRHIVTIINAYGSPPSYKCILILCTKRLHVFSSLWLFTVMILISLSGWGTGHPLLWLELFLVAN